MTLQWHTFLWRILALCMNILKFCYVVSNLLNRKYKCKVGVFSNKLAVSLWSESGTTQNALKRKKNMRMYSNEKVLLEQLTENDADFLYDIYSHPQITVNFDKSPFLPKEFTNRIISQCEFIFTIRQRENLFF